MKMVFFEVDDYAQKLLLEAFPNDNIICSSNQLTDQSDVRQCSQAQVLSVAFYSHITKQVLDQFPNLQLLITRSTGYEHIDLNAAHERKIVVCYAPIYASESVAEHTFALMLMLAKKMKKACCSAHMFKESAQELQGFNLMHKTLGIIGFGNIGKIVAKIAQGFGMNCIINDDVQKQVLEKNSNFLFVDLKTLWASSDIITFHVPLTKQTHHLLNKKSLKDLKKGVYIINTARGQIVDTEALFEGLENTTIAGAGLDVLEYEVFTKDPLLYQKTLKPTLLEYKIILENYYALIDNPNVVVTCHNAYNTQESLEKLMNHTITLINDFKVGKKIESL